MASAPVLSFALVEHGMPEIRDDLDEAPKT
jgi:hypothetical protein